MSDPYDPDDYLDDDCPNCGGVGYVHDCIDGCCLEAELGCDLCTRNCDWCNRARPAEPAEPEAGEAVAGEGTWV